MTVTYHAGRRLQGLDSDRTATALPTGSVGGWVELGRTTLGGTADDITVSSLSNKRYYMFMYHGINSSAISHTIRLGNGSTDTGSNYSWRKSYDGGSDTTGTSVSYMESSGANSSPGFGVGYITNRSASEKLVMWHHHERLSAGAASVSDRFESVGKWANTSNPLDVVTYHNTGAGDYAANSELVVLGWDPADTHTTNFWQELASVNASGSSTTLSSGTFTAKKYLWVQCYTEGTSADIYTNFNDVTTGSQYNRRYSFDGGSDLTNTSQNFIANMHNAGRAGEEAFSNWFIINNASNEKLVIGHSIQQGGTGATATPRRAEFINKWANTSDQITKINFVSQTGNFGTNSILKVWGAD